MSTQDTEVGVIFSADASGAVQGAATTRSAVQSINPDVKALSGAMLELSATMKAGFEQMSASSERTRNEIKHDVEEEEKNLLGLVKSVHEAAESFNEFKSALSEIAEVWLAVFAVEQVVEFAKKLGEAGEKIEHMASSLGMTATEVQKLQGYANASGSTLEAVQVSVTKLDVALGQAHQGIGKFGDAFKRIGVDVNESHTQFELFQQSITGLANIKDPFVKVQTARELFGRGMIQIAGLIGITKEQLADFNDQVEKYGLQNETAVETGAHLGAQFNENKNAMQGVSNVLTEALAPAMTEVVKSVNEMIAGFIKSYKEGGAAKQTMDALALTFKVVIITVDTLVTTFDVLWKSITGGIQIAEGVFVAGLEAMKWALNGVIYAAMTYATVVKDALTLNFGAIEADFKSGMERSAAAFDEGGRKAAAAFGKSYAEGMKNLGGAGGAINAFEKRNEALFGASAHHAEKPEGEEEQAGTGNGGGGKKGKNTDETEMQRLKNQFEATENAHNDMITNMGADELAFWKSVLDGSTKATLSAKERSQIEIQVGKLTHSQAIERIHDEQAEDKAAAAQKIANANNEFKETSALLKQKSKDIDEAYRMGSISAEQANAQHKSLIAQELVAATNAARLIAFARITADNQIRASSARNTPEYRAALKDQEAAELQFAKARIAARLNADAQIKASNDKTTNELTAKWNGYTSGMVKSLSTGLRGMLQGTMSFSQMMGNIFNSMLDVVFQVVESMVQKWLVGLAMQALGQKVTGAAIAEAGVAEQAAVAGAGMTAWMSANPLTAPAAITAGLAQSAEVVSIFGGMAGFAGGHPNVPFDGIAKIHTGETILPASIASPLRSMIAANGNSIASGGAAAVAGGSGGDHYHIAVSALDARSIDHFMRGSGGDAIVKGLVAKRRQNAGASAQ